MSTEPETAAAEGLEPLPVLPGEDWPAASEISGDPLMPSWADLQKRAADDLAAVRERAGMAHAQIARDHEAALDALDERPVIVQERPAGDAGRPFDVQPGSFLAAASCPSCGYGLGGRTVVHVLAGRGANRTAEVRHEECARNPL